MDAELAKRATKAKHWHVLPGMLDECGDRVLRVRDDGRYATELDGSGKVLHWEEPDIVPDLDDAATLGCLEHLVREAWAGCQYDIGRIEQGYRVFVWMPFDGVKFELSAAPTLAEALVAALEAAP